MKFNLENRTLKVGINILVMLIILIVLHFFIGRWILSNLDKAKKKSLDLLEQLTAIDDSVRQYPEPDKKMEEINKAQEELLKKSVSKEEIPRIIQQLTRKSSELSIEIISIKSVEGKSSSKINLPQGISKTYLEVVLKTPYKTLGEYLKAMNELPIIITVEGISLERPSSMEDEASAKGKAENKILATMLISSYTVWE